ncbi:hypothetical protein H0H87_005560, partial [Tephrocybe sp. NHM501043]
MPPDITPSDIPAFLTSQINFLILLFKYLPRSLPLDPPDSDSTYILDMEDEESSDVDGEFNDFDDDLGDTNVPLSRVVHAVLGLEIAFRINSVDPSGRVVVGEDDKLHAG